MDDGAEEMAEIEDCSVLGELGPLVDGVDVRFTTRSRSAGWRWKSKESGLPLDDGDETVWFVMRSVPLLCSGGGGT